MNVKQILLSLLIISLSASFSQGQELDCRIQVNSRQIEGTNKTVFEALQKALFEFMNNRTWTSHVYAVEERVECSFLLNLTHQISADEFKGSLQITSNRPVFNSGYSSPMLNVLDENIQFRYAEGQPLEFNESTHNELTSLFAFYAYIILGVDYDSFSPLGGTPYFETAEKIVSNAQSSAYVGWKAFEDKRNRYWMAENYMNNTYEPLRNYSYTYHRKGLDLMSTKAAEGRSNMANGLTELLKVHRQKPNSYIMNLFFEVKADEIVNALSESPTSEAMRAYNLLKEVDPSNSDTYEKIIKKN